MSRTKIVSNIVEFKNSSNQQLSSMTSTAANNITFTGTNSSVKCNVTNVATVELNKQRLFNGTTNTASIQSNGNNNVHFHGLTTSDLVNLSGISMINGITVNKNYYCQVSNNSTNLLPVSKTYADMPVDTMGINVDGTNFILSNNAITIARTGHYKCSYTVTTYTSRSRNNGQIEIRSIINSNVITESQTTDSLTESNNDDVYTSTSKTFIFNVTLANTIFSVQVKYSGNVPNIYFDNNSNCSIILEKIT